MGLRTLGRCDASFIKESIKDSILRLGLELSNCRGQCYDGASVMAGHKAGVSTLMLKVSKHGMVNIIYVYVCVNHYSILRCYRLYRPRLHYCETCRPLF